MARIKLTIEYDGTDFVGWQRQANGLSVQQLIEDALARLLNHPVTLHASGRTDAGVHAHGMVAHFDTDQHRPLVAYVDGINGQLPMSVAIRSAQLVDDGFHSRFQACGKWYRYTILRDLVRSPLHGRTSWQVKKPLDVAAMKSAAAFFLGRHDFTSFRSSRCDSEKTVKIIYEVSLTEDDNLLLIDVKGSGFLRNMVRMMVGTLVEVGIGRWQPQRIQEMLATPMEQRHRLTAPPQGLCLMEVWHSDEGPPAGV